MQHSSSTRHPDLPLAAKAMDVILEAMRAGHPIVVAWSSGKDSSAVANLALCAAKEMVDAGEPSPRIALVHSDTGVENPEVRLLADAEILKIEAFAASLGISASVSVGKPSLYSSWAVSVIGGRALPSFPNSKGDCSVDYKIRVNERLQRQALEDLSSSSAQPVVLTGVRMDESARRAANIAKRVERDDAIWLSQDGKLRLSPILSWSADDVFEYLGYAHAGLITTYSDFAETMRFYRDAGGSSCAVVGDMMMDRRKTGCGARSGCWSCVKISKDESLQQMIASDPGRYGYLRGLGRLRDFIAATQYDWTRRNHLHRTIDAAGFVKVEADGYSPQMLEDLLRYAVTLDLIELSSSRKLGIKPRFSIIGPRELVAIDMTWSMYGLHMPFHAIHVYFEVMGGGAQHPPATPAYERVPPKPHGRLGVGLAWPSDLLDVERPSSLSLVSGIRDVAAELHHESCGPSVKAASTGHHLTAWGTAESFDVDEESAMDFIGCLADDYIAEYHRPEVDRTMGLVTYLRLGLVTPAHASLGRWNRIAERTQRLQRLGLVGQVCADPAQILAIAKAQGIQCVPPSSLPITGPSPAMAHPAEQLAFNLDLEGV